VVSVGVGCIEVGWPLLTSPPPPPPPQATTIALMHSTRHHARKEIDGSLTVLGNTLESLS
jgi:hypothetical protein